MSGGAHMRGVFAWTAAIEADLKVRWQEKGQSTGEIAKAYGVSRNAVIGKISRKGWSRPRTETTAKMDSLMGGRRGGARSAAAREPRPAKAPLYLNQGAVRERAPEAPLPEPSPKAKGDVARIAEPESGRCKWPVGDPGEPGFGFCGLTAGGRYCDEHERRSRAPMQPKRRAS